MAKKPADPAMELPMPSRALALTDDAAPQRLSAADRIERLNALFPKGDEPDAADLHVMRFNMWLCGMTEKQIGEVDGVAEQTVRRSMWYCLFRLPGGTLDRVQARNEHTIARAQLEASDEYQSALLKLFSEESWTARSAALKHYRHTVGLQGTSAVTVNVDNRKQQFNAGGAMSFESIMDSVRRKQIQEANVQDAEIVVPEGEVQADAGADY